MNELFNILKNLFKGNEIVYISTPINTGERFINWYSTVGKILIEDKIEYQKELTKNVVYPNIKNSKECIKKIRNIIQKTIIDPTNLENDILNWEQEEFYQFWDRVIKELVNEIIFLDGWEYSVGCCCELLSGIENNKEIYSQDMKILSINEIIIKLENSINQYKLNNLKEEKRITKILDKIKENYYE